MCQTSRKNVTNKRSNIFSPRFFDHKNIFVDALITEFVNLANQVKVEFSVSNNFVYPAIEKHKHKHYIYVGDL